jgi:hypothetical protein
MKLNYGERNHVIFETEEDFFEAIGYLANSDRGLYISSEQSDNRWGAEYRLWLEDISDIPEALDEARSAGLDAYEARINCNEYVYELVSNFGFAPGKRQNANKIRAIIEDDYSDYLYDYDRGYNL